VNSAKRIDRLFVAEVAEREARQHVVDTRNLDLALEPVAYLLRRSDDCDAGVDGGGEILRDRIVLQGIVVHAP